MIDKAISIGLQPRFFIMPIDIIKGNALLNTLFISAIFKANHGLGKSEQVPEDSHYIIYQENSHEELKIEEHDDEPSV